MAWRGVSWHRQMVRPRKIINEITVMRKQTRRIDFAFQCVVVTAAAAMSGDGSNSRGVGSFRVLTPDRN